MTKLTLKDKRDEENALLTQEFLGAGPGNISYDYFKHMVSLSLVTLGGVLGLSESFLAGKVTFAQLMIPCAPIAMAGMLALQCQSDIVQIARGQKSATVYLRLGHRLVSGLLGAGIGAFLILISKAI
jgi:uncharacterized protein YbcI